MLRSILVALDGSESSINATNVALDLASAEHAHVEGLGIVNSGAIQRPEPVPVGGTAIKAGLDLWKLDTARERVERVLENFRAEVVERSIALSSVRETDGDPLQVIARAATAHDLVAFGRDSLFDVEGEFCELPLCVEKIIRDEPRPILLVPSRLSEDWASRRRKSVLIAFDDSAAASRALHMFALLGLGKGATTHVLTVCERADEATEAAGQACQLLTRHGAAEAHPIGLGDNEAGSPSETILGTAKALGAELIVMGAYGRRGIREMFGSTTREVLNACPTAIFLHH